MPGFGSGPFGSEPFGAFPWAYQVLWKDLPQLDRNADAETSGQHLEKYQRSIIPLFEELLTFARDFEQLRDPDSVRTTFQDNISVTIDSAEATEDGRTIRVEFNDPDPNDPLVPLGRASVGWILVDDDGRQFFVNEVHKLSSAAIVLGSAVLPVTGDATLRPPALIGLLGNDYGMIVDQHEPEAFQRSSVRNAFQWLAMKGVQKSYQIIGDIAGYDVVAIPLWRVRDPIPANIPVGNLFEAPLGSGIFYTDLEPSRPHFDELAMDFIPLDLYCWEEPDWTAIAPPPSPVPPAGTTVQEAISQGIEALTITSTTDLGDGRWRIRVSGDLERVASLGYWWAEFVGTPGVKYYLETLTMVAASVWDFEVLVGDTAPTWGATVGIYYDCHLDMRCNFCRASAIRVEIRPAGILLEPEALLDNALERMVRKILRTVPIHVRLTDLVHIVGPIDALVGVDLAFPNGHLIAVPGNITASLFATASVGFYFDIVPMDAVPLDPQHLVASGSVTTIP